MKPPYEIPSMDEIRNGPRSGYVAISTFSGCGGSSLGLTWAGLDVAVSSEFVEAARDVYRANFPGTPIDAGDVRETTGRDLLRQASERIGRTLEPGDVDLLEGSPPCSDFSMAGGRSKSWGRKKGYSDTVQRSDDLFFEFARLVREIQPRVLIAENVAGLTRGVAKGYFKEIHRALTDAGYRVEAKILDASWLGVPQARKRLFFVGVRNDIDERFVWPEPFPYQYTIRDALPWIDGVGTRSGLRSADEPSPTVLTHGNPHTRSELSAVRIVGGAGAPFDQKGAEFHLDEPSPTIVGGQGARGSHQLIVEVEPGSGAPGFARREQRRYPIDEPVPTVLAGKPDQFKITTKTAAITGRTGPQFGRVESELDEPMNTILQSDPAQARYELRATGLPPGWEDMPDEERGRPIGEYAIGREWDLLRPGGSSERYFSLVRPHPDEPVPTVTQTAGIPGAAGVTHPIERRKFSIPELRRLSGFPDDFILTGSYSQRWERIGRAVPPPVSYAIGTAVVELLLRIDR